MNAAIVERIWDLCRLGSARSAGWGGHDTSHELGSGFVFAYGYNRGDNDQAGMTIYSGNGGKRILEPATQENVLEALTQMGITETDWSI